MNRPLALLITGAVSVSCGACSPSAEDLRKDPHGHLVWAARTGDAAAIRRLAESGVDLDAAPATRITFVFPDFDHAQWTAMKHAVQKHQVESVRALLAAGADPDAREAGSAITPLFIAAGDTDQTIARLLVDAGADVNLSRQALTAEEPGGPLWHIFEHAMDGERQTRKEALERIAAAARPQRSLDR
jgi:ankyrin repeat protein